MAQWFNRPKFRFPRTHTKLGMVPCICDPRAPTVRCEVESRESQGAPTAALLASTAVNKRPLLIKGGRQGPTPMLSLEMTYMCFPKHCVQMREGGRERGERENTRTYNGVVGWTQNEDETFSVLSPIRHSIICGKEEASQRID